MNHISLLTIHHTYILLISLCRWTANLRVTFPCFTRITRSPYVTFGWSLNHGPLERNIVHESRAEAAECVFHSKQTILWFCGSAQQSTLFATFLHFLLTWLYCSISIPSYLVRCQTIYLGIFYCSMINDVIFDVRLSKSVIILLVVICSDCYNIHLLLNTHTYLNHNKTIEMLTYRFSSFKKLIVFGVSNWMRQCTNHRMCASSQVKVTILCQFNHYLTIG